MLHRVACTRSILTKEPSLREKYSAIKSVPKAQTPQGGMATEPVRKNLKHILVKFQYLAATVRVYLSSVSIFGRGN
ncbi:hypothetical protein NPIL_422081 [Nephila pilipes]|uniref:Uncharacterized protein n=1 Tax=Nephila pilipes TaxID=299642 RepID=A0A8X6IFH1_NEPPI|nr:hypothetical protein NPIL_422081 [Nephila pilipes]